MRSILIIEDNRAMAATVEEYLSHDDYNIELVHNGRDALDRFNSGKKPDGILLDLNLPDMHGFDILKELYDDLNSCAVVIITAEASMTSAVEAMQLGAHDFVPKPISPERLRVSLKNALERVQLTQIAHTYQKISRTQFEDFVGKSPKMQAVYNVLENAAQSKASVFITGESGTGKELAARAVHNLSARSNKPFEVLNCAAIPHNLLESEIFGHVKGAFTGATSDRKGAAARANGGTLFLDELGEMPMDLQAKLLRFIQSGTFMAVGDTHMQDVDLRFICATNRDPLAAVKEGRLREDLYYRLNVIPVQLPPLRERGEDIMLLAKHFLEQAAREESKSFQSFSSAVANLFSNYRWTGNVRELENTIRRIVVLNDGETVEPEMLSAIDTPADQTLEKLAADSMVHTDSFLPRTSDQIKSLSFYEKEVIQAALDACNGNITQAAKRLDINPATIHRKLKQWTDSK